MREKNLSTYQDKQQGALYFHSKDGSKVLWEGLCFPGHQPIFEKSRRSPANVDGEREVAWYWVPNGDSRFSRVPFGGRWGWGGELHGNHLLGAAALCPANLLGLTAAVSHSMLFPWPTGILAVLQISLGLQRMQIWDSKLIWRERPRTKLEEVCHGSAGVSNSGNFWSLVYLWPSWSLIVYLK